MDQSPLCPGAVGKHLILLVVVGEENSLLQIMLPYPKVDKEARFVQSGDKDMAFQS